MKPSHAKKAKAVKKKEGKETRVRYKAVQAFKCFCCSKKLETKEPIIEIKCLRIFLCPPLASQLKENLFQSYRKYALALTVKKA